MIKKDVYVNLFMNWAVAICYNVIIYYVFVTYLCIMSFDIQNTKISKADIISVLLMRMSEAQRG